MTTPVSLSLAHGSGFRHLLRTGAARGAEATSSASLAVTTEGALTGGGSRGRVFLSHVLSHVCPCEADEEGGGSG